MNRAKFLISLVLSISILMLQVGGVFAAPATQDSITGRVHRITLDTDPSTGITVVIVELVGHGHGKQIVRISEETAISLGLVMLDVDGPVINTSALGTSLVIEPAQVIPSQAEEHHPVANALATLFAGIDEEESLYDIIMTAHHDGVGFGLIAQALWLTREIPGGDVEDFQALLQAKQSGNYTGFTLEDGSAPKNWAELRRAIAAGKKLGNLGTVMKEKNPGSNAPAEEKQDKGKGNEPEKVNTGNGGNSENAKDKEKKK